MYMQVRATVLLVFLFLLARLLLRCGIFFELFGTHEGCIHTDGAVGIFVNVLPDFLILDVVFIPCNIGTLHKIGQHIGQRIAFFTGRHEASFLQHILGDFSVVAIVYREVTIWDALGLCHQVLALHNGIGIVYIELEIGHDGEMVPQLVLEVVDIAQVREQVAHDIYDGIGTTGTLLPVGNREAVIDHLLHIAPILGQDKFFEL